MAANGWSHKVIAGNVARRTLRNKRAPGTTSLGVGGVDDVVERTRIYGAVPPPMEYAKLTREQRLTLVAKIEELRARRLTWPQVALALGIKTSQAEKAWRDYKE